MLTHPMPDPIAFSIGPVHVHWYGLMYVLAFAMFIALGRVRIKQPHIAAQGWKNEDLDDMLFYGMLGVIIGGRLGEVFFYTPQLFLDDPLEIFKVWHGGMSFHGGFIGVMVAMALWARKAGRNLLDVYDFIAPLVPLGYAAGRIGNFINAELPGRVADASLPWAMLWPDTHFPLHAGAGVPRRPAPSVAAVPDAGRRPAGVHHPVAVRAQGAAAAGGRRDVHLLYGCARFFTEYFRVPDWEVHGRRRADHLGPDAVAADDRRRAGDAGVGLLARREAPASRA